MGSGHNGADSNGCCNNTQLLPVAVETLLRFGFPKDIVLSVFHTIVAGHTPRDVSRRDSQSAAEDGGSRGSSNDVVSHSRNDLLSRTLSRERIGDVIRGGSDASCDLPLPDGKIFTGSGATNSESREAIYSNLSAAALLVAVEDVLRSTGRDPWRHQTDHVTSSHLSVGGHEGERRPVGLWTSQDLQDDGDRRHSVDTPSQPSGTGQQQQQQKTVVSGRSAVSADHLVPVLNRVATSQENTHNCVDTSQENTPRIIVTSQKNTSSSVDTSQDDTLDSEENTATAIAHTRTSAVRQPGESTFLSSELNASVVSSLTRAGEAQSQTPPPATENVMAVAGDRNVVSTKTPQSVSSRASNSVNGQGTEGLPLPTERPQQPTSLLPSARREVHESPPLLHSAESGPASVPSPATTTEPSATECTEREKTHTTTGERSRRLQRLRALRAENKRLKARQFCRHCHVRPVSLTLLPCGHFCFCVECGSTFAACPLCGKTILADVRTFVS